MNLNDLRTANFAKLDDAVTKWDEMVGKLEKLSADVRTDVKGKADKANWKGVNADVSRQFIRKTATEFDEMETQAKSIRNILRDTAGELRGYQKSINSHIDAAPDLHVTDLGGGKFQVEVRDGAPEGTDPEQLRDHIERKLSAATTSDKSTADVLNSMMKLTDMGFSDVSYADRDAAAQALKDAKRAAELAEQGPGELSPEEFDELNSLTAEHNDDPLFAERFATTLGPQGVVEFWTGIHSIQSSELLDERLDKYGELQQNLGLTLATATRSDSTAMTQWEWKMSDLGDEKVVIDGVRTNTYGFQAMSSLMHSGDFDDDFLDTYGNQLIEAEKQLSYNGARSESAWFDPVMGVGNLSHIEGDNGRDPFIGYMKALSNSPDASLEFFNDEFVSKDEDHDFENGDGEKRSLSVFDYLFDERQWPTQHDADFNEVDTGHDALGQALEAATTGHPADAPPSAEHFAHSQEQADLFENIVNSVSADPNRLAEHSAMSDSMGQISAEYMPDISRALNPGEEYEDKLFPVADAVSTPGERDVTRFLHTVGRDPDGFAAVTLGQHNYSTGLMEYHFQNPSAYISDPSFSETANLKTTAMEVGTNSGTIQGIVGAGRTYEVAEVQATEDAEFNSALDSANAWASGLVGAGVGIATAGAGPGAAVAGAVANTATGEILNSITSGLQQDNTAETIYRNGENWSAYHDSTVALVRDSAESGGELSGNTSRNIVVSLGDATMQGFGYAQDRVKDHMEGHGVPADNMDTP